MPESWSWAWARARASWLPRALAACAAAFVTAGSAPAAEPDLQSASQIERGRYLATAADCIGCHTVMQGAATPGDKGPFAGGRSIETPFGSMVSPNITPDRETGIGAWTDEQFDAALRKGRRRDGSPMYPAMPYTAYTRMSRDDVAAIRSYLATLEPVRNPVESNTLPFPFNLRALMHVWNTLFFDEGPYRPDPAKSAEWNRGAYLVNGPAHCPACHTAKNFLGGDKSDLALQGGQVQGWFAPDLTNSARTGLGNWSADDVVEYLKTGHNRSTAATGPMAEAVALSTSKMSQPDLKAIAIYLKALPGSRTAPMPLRADDPIMTAGEAIYRDQCTACHGIDGRGVPRLFPSLADSSMVQSSDMTSSIRIVLRGARSVATDAEPTAPGMPAYGWQLDDAKVAAVLTFIRNKWGGGAPAVAVDQVRQARADLQKRAD